jgi:hypothetical protein
MSDIQPGLAQPSALRLAALPEDDVVVGQICRARPDRGPDLLVLVIEVQLSETDTRARGRVRTDPEATRDHPASAAHRAGTRERAGLGDLQVRGCRPSRGVAPLEDRHRDPQSSPPHGGARDRLTPGAGGSGRGRPTAGLAAPHAASARSSRAAPPGGDDVSVLSR